jgi:hypothetical protein
MKEPSSGTSINAPRKKVPSCLLHHLHTFTVNFVFAAVLGSREPTVKEWRSMKDDVKERFSGKRASTKAKKEGSLMHPSGVLHAFTVKMSRASRTQITRAHRVGMKESEGQHEGAFSRDEHKRTQKESSFMPPSWPLHFFTVNLPPLPRTSDSFQNDD